MFIPTLLYGGGRNLNALRVRDEKKINKKKFRIEMTGNYISSDTSKETEEDGPVLRCTYTLIY